MKKKTRRKVKYTNELLELEAVPDFLPPSKDLVLKENPMKVTLSLSQSSVDFSKNTP